MTTHSNLPKIAIHKPIAPQIGAAGSYGYMADALQQFQTWLLELRHKGLALTSADMVIQIAESVSQRFCIGIAEDRMFFGVQENELTWFRGLPWLHVAARRGSHQIAFVSEETSVSGITLPAFALAFRTDGREKIDFMIRHHYLDIREVEFEEDSRATAVGALLTTIDIVIVEDDHSLLGLVGDRLMGCTNRSVFTKATK